MPETEQQDLVNIVDTTYGFRYAQAETLTQQIKANRGTLNILVHPFYERFHRPVDHPPSLLYVYQRDMFVKNCLLERKPLIVFEERDNIPSLRSYIPSSVKSDLYVVATRESDPTIEADFWNWRNFVQNLQRFEVRNISIGGQYLWYYDYRDFKNRWQTDAAGGFVSWYASPRRNDFPLADSWMSQGLVPSGCVGLAAWMFLEAGFDVNFSAVTSPGLD